MIDGRKGAKMWNGSNVEVERVPITDEFMLDLAEQLTVEERPVAFTTTRGMPLMAAMPWQLYESVIETMEEMGNTEMAVKLRRGIEDVVSERNGSDENTDRPWSGRHVSKEIVDKVMNEVGWSYLDS